MKVVQESHGPNIKKSVQIGIEGSRRQGKKCTGFQEGVRIWKILGIW